MICSIPPDPKMSAHKIIGCLLVLISEMVNPQCCMTQTYLLVLRANLSLVPIMCWELSEDTILMVSGKLRGK